MMSNAEFGTLTVFLFLLLLAARLLGSLFASLRQPRVIGEILAGVALGPLVSAWAGGDFLIAALPLQSGAPGPYAPVMAFLSSFGLLLLMFSSGAETKGLFNRGDRREVAWLGVVGTALPFGLALALGPWLPLDALAGPLGSGARLPLLLVVAIGVAVTSIPVMSKILHDLNLLQTRFARLVLGVAVIEDMVLWAVLAVALALGQSGQVPTGRIAMHVLVASAYFGTGLVAAPSLLRRLSQARWNVLLTTSPIAYVMVVLLAYTAVASLLEINIVFAAFLAGYGLIATKDERVHASLGAVTAFSFAVFIPIYFAMVGYRLDLLKTFSWTMLLVFLGGSSLAKVVSAGLGARIAGFTSRESMNLAIALNARGGPGIVVASVAFEAGIINGAFYTTLVLAAILTSQAAGVWLERELRGGRPLLVDKPVAAAGSY